MALRPNIIINCYYFNRFVEKNEPRYIARKLCMKYEYLLQLPLRKRPDPRSPLRNRYVSLVPFEMTARLEWSVGSQAEHAGDAPTLNSKIRSSERTSHCVPKPLILQQRRRMTGAQSASAWSPMVYYLRLARSLVYYQRRFSRTSSCAPGRTMVHSTAEQQLNIFFGFFKRQIPTFSEVPLGLTLLCCFFLPIMPPVLCSFFLSSMPPKI